MLLLGLGLLENTVARKDVRRTRYFEPVSACRKMENGFSLLALFSGAAGESAADAATTTASAGRASGRSERAFRAELHGKQGSHLGLFRCWPKTARN